MVGEVCRHGVCEGDPRFCDDKVQSVTKAKVEDGPMHVCCLAREGRCDVAFYTAMGIVLMRTKRANLRTFFHTSH